MEEENSIPPWPIHPQSDHGGTPPWSDVVLLSYTYTQVGWMSLLEAPFSLPAHFLSLIAFQPQLNPI